MAFRGALNDASCVVRARAEELPVLSRPHWLSPSCGHRSQCDVLPIFRATCSTTA